MTGIKSTGQSTTRGYSFLMRLIHWTMALIMTTMIIAGILMVNVYNTFNATTSFLYDYHRGMGFVLLILVIVRLIVKSMSTPPSPLPAEMPDIQKQIAKFTHFLLYTALVVQPLLGWYATNTWGVKKIPIFGLFNLPTIADKNRELGDLLLLIHGYIGFLITALIVLHVGAALFHQFVKKDGVLLRMIRT